VADPEFQIHEEDGPFDWAVGFLDGHTRTVRRLDMTNIIKHPSSTGGWGVTPFFLVVWGQFHRMGAFQDAFGGHLTNFGGQAVYDAVMEAPSAAKNYREALVSDFMMGYLPSFGVSTDVGDTFGTTPSGKVAYTPFFHPTLGKNNPVSLAALFSRLVQFELNFGMANICSQRVRSLERLDSSSVTINPLATDNGHESFHTIGVDEGGSNRAPLFHGVFRSDDDPRLLRAVWINDYTARRGGSYRFDPSRYIKDVPLGASASTSNIPGYTVTKHTVNHDGIVSDAAVFVRASSDYSISLGPGEMVVYDIDFGSDLRWQYAYDNETMREIALPATQTQVTIEDHHGAGRRFIFGVKSDLPDQDYKIASVDLRVFKQGESEKQ
jgi:hypothetical protein